LQGHIASAIHSSCCCCCCTPLFCVQARRSITSSPPLPPSAALEQPPPAHIGSQQLHRRLQQRDSTTHHTLRPRPLLTAHQQLRLLLTATGAPQAGKWYVQKVHVTGTVDNACRGRGPQSSRVSCHAPLRRCSCSWPCGHSATMAPPLPVNLAAAPTPRAVAIIARLVSPSAASPNICLQHTQVACTQILTALLLYLPLPCVSTHSRCRLRRQPSVLLDVSPQTLAAGNIPCSVEGTGEAPLGGRQC
jgi:hypothetical protein